MRQLECEIVLLLDADSPQSNAIDSRIKGISLGLDLTDRRELLKARKSGLPWTTAKSFPGAAVVCEFQNTNDFKNLSQLKFEMLVNGETRMLGSPESMRYTITQMIDRIEGTTGLEKNDIVYLGAPEKGIGIAPGDEITLRFTEFPNLHWTYEFGKLFTK